jgi:hypothetical protein
MERAAMSDARPSGWGLVSVACPFVGFLAGAAVGTLGQGYLWSGHPMDGIFWGVAAWAGFCLFGLVAAGLSWSRAEGSGMLSGVGFALNALLPVALLGSGVWYLIEWWRVG